MRISGDETDVLAHREREQVVVSRVRRTHRRRRVRVRDDVGDLTKQADELGSLSGRDPISHFRVRERALDLTQQRLAHDELERPREPQFEQPRGRAGLREDGGNENVRIEERAHALCAVLSLDGELQRLVLIEVSRSPESVEQIES